MYLFLHCLLCTSICLLVIRKYNGQQGFYGLEKKHTCTRNYRLKISTRIRKIFHIIAIVIYLPAIWADPEFLVLAANCALIAFLILEVNSTYICYKHNVYIHSIICAYLFSL